jgi:NAD-dependent deacetylase
MQLPPTCSCGAPIRPEVVLFGEMLPAAAVGRMHRALAKSFDVVFTIGTTSVFPYIAEPVIDQARSGGFAVEINPGDSRVSRLVTHRIRSGAASALSALWDRLEA